MRKHHYRVSVEAADASGQLDSARRLVFHASCHDDILQIVERARERGMLPPDEAAAMAVGLKLLGEVVLSHRNEALFSELCGHLGAFIKKLKSGEGSRETA